MLTSNEKLYHNRDWLFWKYHVNKLSLSQIGREVGVDSTTILWQFKLHNIPTRSVAEGEHLRKANHCELTYEAIEWIEGELLGDGHLELRSSYTARFEYNSKYLEYAQYVSETLKSFGIEQAGKIREYYYKQRDGYSYSYISRCYPEFLLLRKKWYPKGKKIVPRDIKFTPIICRQWFIGDGSLVHSKNGRSHICISSVASAISDIKWVVKQFNELGFRTTRSNASNSIYISACSTQDFLNYIRKCPVQCYQYKWLYQDNCSYIRFGKFYDGRRFKTPQQQRESAQ